MNLKKLSFVLAFVLSITSAAHALEWRGIFIAGDDSIDNFDNGRMDLTQMFSNLGSLTTVQLSSSKKFISQQNQVYPAVAQNVATAFKKTTVKSGEGCLIHMTSHGLQGQGFYFSMAGILSPETFETLVNSACGQEPTVILVSACYSGQFITEGLKGPNRIILSAARADRPSFGCSADTRYTYWDECLLTEIPKSSNWPDAYNKVNVCITGKEKALGANPSEPQAYFGENTKEWPILH